MRVAVISDIHANLAALEAVLAAVGRDRPDELWCLGDLVGYGPRPNECCALVRDRADLCLIGNHDLVATGGLSLDDFNDDAAAAARWTIDALDGESAAFLRGLAASGARAGVELFHGSARDPVWEYVLSEEAARATFALTASPLVVVGHSHVALALSGTRRGVGGGLAADGAVFDLGGARWLLNPGSVGQPRDGDPRAAYLVLDLDERRATFRRIGYPVAQTQAEMRRQGLPEQLVQRLAAGE